MFVYEEIIINEYDVCVLDIVGYEGIWGVLISSIFVSCAYFLPGYSFGSLDNPIDAFTQTIFNHKLLIAFLLPMLVIGPFNYFGTSLTKYSSAMQRTLIDNSKVIIVWMISIYIKWEKVHILQIIGFVLIITGNILYFEVKL